MAAATADPARRVAVITGASGGVGLACAQRFAAGHRLVLADRDPAALDQRVAEFATEGVEAVAVAGDVRDPAHAAAIAQAVGGAPLGPVVCAAGLSSHMAPGDVVFAVNLIGTALVFDALRESVGPGSVGIGIASMSGHRGAARSRDALLVDPLRKGALDELMAAEGDGWTPGLAYAFSKRGVILLCEREARAWGDRGGRIVSISPGLINTTMGRFEAEQGDGNARDFAALTPLGRLAEAADIAALAAFLASPEASYITGTDVRIDGGTTPDYEHHTDAATLASWHRPPY